MINLLFGWFIENKSECTMVSGRFFTWSYSYHSETTILGPSSDGLGTSLNVVTDLHWRSENLNLIFIVDNYFFTNKIIYNMNIFLLC